jgi:3-phenylpropionate/trans-cinnamate dioxygenase ferredoxin subunit
MRVSVAKTSDIPPGERGFVEAGGNYLVVFNVGGAYYAVEDVCTHDDGPLGDGPLLGYEIECPRHGARFDIRTGKVTRMPAVTPIQWFPVHVVDDEIQIEVSD